MKRNHFVPELTVLNFSASIDFYINILGFKILYARANPNFAYLEFEKIQFMIEEQHENGWNIGTLEKPLGRGVNFQIICENVDPILERLEEQEIILYSELEEVWYNSGISKIGNKEFIVQDPDDYMLRFCEDLGEIPA